MRWEEREDAMGGAGDVAEERATWWSSGVAERGMAVWRWDSPADDYGDGDDCKAVRAAMSGIVVDWQQKASINIINIQTKNA